MKYDPAEIKGLSERLHLDFQFLLTFLEISRTEIPQGETPLELDHKSLRRVRQLQRLCEAFEIDPLVGELLLEQTERISRLEEELGQLRYLLSMHAADVEDI